MKKLAFPGFVVLALGAVLAAVPAFGHGDDALRALGSGGHQLLPPVDCVPPNLEPANPPEEFGNPPDIGQQPDNSYESRYRGVVAANVDSSTLRDELVVDFGPVGVWVDPGVMLYSGTWQQISGANPDWIFSVRWGDLTHEDIIGDFGALGLWKWSHSGYPGTWTQLSGAASDQGLAVDDDGDDREEIQVDFGSLGLWRYDADTAVWTQFSGLNPVLGGVRKDMWNTGNEEGAWGFSGQGVWSFHTNEAAGKVYRHQMSGIAPSYPNVSADFITGGEPEELIMNFGSTLGTWISQGPDYPTMTWDQISASYLFGATAARFVGDANSELLVDFANNAGFWMWEYNGLPGDWTKLSDTDPGDGFFEPFDPNGYEGETTGDEEVAVDFDSLGLNLYDRTTGSFTLLSASNPIYMVRADLWETGTIDECLVVDFGTAGLWAYDGYNSAWHQLSGLSPD